jgi:hypothetical protein
MTFSGHCDKPGELPLAFTDNKIVGATRPPDLAGSENTYSALPFAGWWISGEIAAGTLVVTAIYCLPLVA